MKFIYLGEEKEFKTNNNSLKQDVSVKDIKNLFGEAIQVSSGFKLKETTLKNFFEHNKKNVFSKLDYNSTYEIIIPKEFQDILDSATPAMTQLENPSEIKNIKTNFVFKRCIATKTVEVNFNKGKYVQECENQFEKEKNESKRFYEFLNGKEIDNFDSKFLQLGPIQDETVFLEESTSNNFPIGNTLYRTKIQNDSNFDKRTSQIAADEKFKKNLGEIKNYLEIKKEKLDSIKSESDKVEFLWKEYSIQSEHNKEMKIEKEKSDKKIKGLETTVNALETTVNALETTVKEMKIEKEKSDKKIKELKSEMEKSDERIDELTDFMIQNKSNAIVRQLLIVVRKEVENNNQAFFERLNNEIFRSSAFAHPRLNSQLIEKSTNYLLDLYKDDTDYCKTVQEAKDYWNKNLKN